MFRWEQSVLFAVVLSGIYAFRYVETPLAGYLRDRMRLRFRSALEGVIAEKTARISAEALEAEGNQALLSALA